ncbi:hypothetical protein PGQ11_014908 [Apiospora arundinis]|uniref:Uncharacterized protein n=1 Tax=Apiospora arundinis TaxID=335852 RepID=A0ABR2HKF0_9PEZI
MPPGARAARQASARRRRVLKEHTRSMPQQVQDACYPCISSFAYEYKPTGAPPEIACVYDGPRSSACGSKEG